MIAPARAADLATGASVATLVVQTQAEIVGIPSGVLLAACAGALFGLAYTKPEDWGRLVSIPAGTRMVRFGWVALRAFGLLFTLTTIAFVSGWAVSTMPHFPLFAWLAQVPPIPFAGLLAFSGQRIFPRALGAIERWLDRRNTA